MSWWKNGLLLGAGGIAGLAIAAWLESERIFDDDHYTVKRETKREPSTAESIEALMEKIRDEAKWAMDECTTDEQREKVYEEVKSSIQKLQAALERSGDKIISDLKASAVENEDNEMSATDPLIHYRSTLEKLLKDLDNSKSTGDNENIIKMELPNSTTRTDVRPS
ncbi:hypothetical protein [Anaerovibrio sp. RM50]|uniref:hypothetical protein n=1 Tax=Anaerovibrio sp. RM50 TaxID=1200557 RepID=UPI00047F25D2|nr:hypothetical protein [Anaerovibrio sp. RM50]